MFIIILGDKILRFDRLIQIFTYNLTRSPIYFILFFLNYYFVLDFIQLLILRVNIFFSLDCLSYKFEAQFIHTKFKWLIFNIEIITIPILRLIRFESRSSHHVYQYVYTSTWSSWGLKSRIYEKEDTNLLMEWN